MVSLSRLIAFALGMLLGHAAFADGPVPPYITPVSAQIMGTNFTLLQLQTALGIGGASGSNTVLIAGSNITITTNSINNYTIASTGGTGGGTNNFVAYTNVAQAFSARQVLTNNLNVLSANAMTNTGLQALAAIVTDGNNGFASSVTTVAELAFVHGVTSALQTQINALVSGAGVGVSGDIPFWASANSLGDLPLGAVGTFLGVVTGPQLGFTASGGSLVGLSPSALTGTGFVPATAVAGQNYTFGAGVFTNGLMLSGTNVNQGGQETLTSSNGQYIVTLITGLTNADNLIVSNLNGSYFRITTNGNYHASNSLNSSSSSITNGGAWFSGSETLGGGLTNNGPTKVFGVAAGSIAMADSVTGVLTNAILTGSGVVQSGNTFTISGGGGGGTTNSMITTNVVGATLNTVYSNYVGGALEVNVGGTVTIAANGSSYFQLVVLGFTNYTAGNSTLVAATAAGVQTVQLSGWVPNASGFYVTNISSGAGNVAAMTSMTWTYATNIVGITIPNAGSMTNYTPTAQSPAMRRTLFTDFNTIANSGTAETAAYTNNLPANTLNVNGNVFDYVFHGSNSTDTSYTETIKVYAGSTSITTSFSALTSATFPDIHVTIMRMGATLWYMTLTCWQKTSVVTVTGTTGTDPLTSILNFGISLKSTVASGDVNALWDKGEFIP
jgi:hypothetical protein